MPPAQIFVIRHAEKPPDTPPPSGVDLDGSEDKHALIVQGWQRAGALVNFFYSPQKPPIQCPTYLYSPPPEGTEDAGGRPYQTITPLGAKLTIEPNTNFCEGDEVTGLVPDVLTRDGMVVLIAWEHNHIPTIANTILGNDTTAPQTWPKQRFDVVWVFTLTQSSSWDFSQVPQLLLAGDLPTVIPTDASQGTGPGQAPP